ncbi:MAG: quinone oxidoreductase [Alphaproteobacteria bacterium]
MVMAIRLHKPGGPEVLCYEQVSVGEPGPGEARVGHAAIGLNYVDTYLRDGTGAYGDTDKPYPLEYPAILGFEAAGTVEAVGPGVSTVVPGDRIAYAAPPMGAYAAARLIPAEVLVKLPDDIDFEIAAAAMLKGLTAEYLLRRCYPVKPGESILIHAAAGGCGLIMSQWARRLGAVVIGTVSSAEKAALALAHGCHHVIDYSREDFPARVRALTDGAGVAAVYDGVGRATFMGSLDCLAPRGHMVLFGQPSGPVEPLHLNALTERGSLFLTRPTLMTCIAKRDELVEAATALFKVIRSGDVRIEVRHRFALADAADAHRALQGRRTTGSSVLLP